MPYFANFSSNPFWLPPNLSHSIFSAHIIDRQAYKSNDWIIDTGAIDHMVHLVSCLTTITSAINTFVYLPNGEKALVTHIGTVYISDNLILYGVLCVPSFTFNLIFVSQLTKSLFCMFDLVHCDLWGPFLVPIIEGYMFFLTIVDDYSRCT